ncbi:hypothetical protein CVT25_003364 [Psilocybe cyanescens]|uniref:DNA sliding clamp PCNA n=1 Tax=Psilocybe cyanescens TaxID=93625 RepID=A0A409X4Z5_PSICY|nr:hypothetical protein CVT25_003364 [Psilocybe cyanescens]
MQQRRHRAESHGQLARRARLRQFRRAGLTRYRCDRPMPLGVNLMSLTKVLRCAKDDDMRTLKAVDEEDVTNLVYEAKNPDRIAEYDMKLMDIDADTLTIPVTEYDARVTLPTSEFTRILRDLSQLDESLRIKVSKEGVWFASDGEAANGSVLFRQSDGGHVNEDDDSIPAGVVIMINQYVSLTFSLKYLVNFSKSASLSGNVQMLMSNDVPLLIAYDFTQGCIRYYLAPPKIGDD